MAAAPDFEDLIKQIKPTANAANVAAATIALRLIRSQALGGTVVNGALNDVFNPGGDFELAIAKIKTQISAL